MTTRPPRRLPGAQLGFNAARRTFAWPLFLGVLLPLLWVRGAEPPAAWWGIGLTLAMAVLVLPMVGQSLGDFPWLNRRLPARAMMLSAAGALAVGIAAAVIMPDPGLSRLVLLAMLWQVGMALGGFIGPIAAVACAAASLGLVLAVDYSDDFVPSVIMAVPAFLVAWAMIWSTQWYLEVLRNLERVQRREASLAVAEERLRIARELHDVLGQRFTAIAVKSELGSQLAEPDSGAVQQFREVRGLAHQSLADMRGLVQSYREADLGRELSGARSLLESAGVAVSVRGDESTVAEAHRDVAAVVLRESVTNILRHSRAERVEIVLAPSAVEVGNDGATEGLSGTGGSGLAGLTERLNAVKGRLDIAREGEWFRVRAELGEGGER